MKTINVTFEDKDFERLEKKKGDMSWEKFILMGVLKNEKHGIQKSA